jgi:tetratricopeptide (TPR) repeat protein
MITEINELFTNYDNIENNDLESTVDFVNKYFSFLINFKSDNLAQIEKIAFIFQEYFNCLSELGRYSMIINKRPDIISFIEKLDPQSRCFKYCYVEIEYLYADALTSSGVEYEKAISSLSNIQKMDPENENISFDLKYAKLNLRRRSYSRFIIAGLTIALIGIALRFTGDNRLFYIIDTTGFVIFVLAYLVQHLDSYMTEKRPTANN